MLATCKRFAARNNLQFSTDPDPSKSKSKYIFVSGKQKKLVKRVPLTLYGKELPWVASATHLGHELHETGTMEHDAHVKRAEFIYKSTKIRDTFSFASPVEVLREVKVFAGDLYRSNLWKLTLCNLSLRRSQYMEVSYQTLCCFSEKVKMVEVPEQDMWRIPYLERLLEKRGEAHYQMGDTNELTELMDSLCMK